MEFCHLIKILKDKKKLPGRNVLKQGDALSPLHFNFALEYAIRKDQVIQVGFKSRKRDAVQRVVQHPSFWTHSRLPFT